MISVLKKRWRYLKMEVINVFKKRSRSRKGHHESDQGSGGFWCHFCNPEASLQDWCDSRSQPSVHTVEPDTTKFPHTWREREVEVGRKWKKCADMEVMLIEPSLYRETISLRKWNMKKASGNSTSMYSPLL